MSDFVTLTCPTCSGKLQITSDVERFACGHCGNEHIVKRTGGIVTIAPIIEGLDKVQVGVDKTASELAIVRLEREIPQIATEVNRLQQAPGMCLLLAAGLLAFAFACAALVIQDWGVAAASSIGGAVLLYASNWQYKATQNNPALARSLNLLEQKRREMARHREMVSQVQQEK